MLLVLCLAGLILVVVIYRKLTQFSSGDFMSGGISENTRMPTSKWAVPLAFFTGWLLSLTKLGFIVHIFGIVLHEVGHSLVSWLAGRLSFPAFIAGLAFSSRTYSLVFSVIVACAVIWLCWQAYRIKSLFLGACCAVLVSGFVYLQFFAGGRWVEWMLFAGDGLEIVFAALLVAAYYAKGPRGWRWDWIRYPLMVGSAWVLMENLKFWTHAVENPVINIYGSDIMASNVAQHDIPRLIRGFGWTPELAAESYMGLTYAALAFSAAVYKTDAAAVPEELPFQD